MSGIRAVYSPAPLQQLFALIIQTTPHLSSFKSSEVIADLKEFSVIGQPVLSRQESPLEVNHSDKNWSTWSTLILCGLDRFSSVFGWHLFLTSVTIIDPQDIIYEQIKFDILSYFL